MKQLILTPGHMVEFIQICDINFSFDFKLPLNLS